MSRWECFKIALGMLWLALAPSKIRKARTGSLRTHSKEEMIPQESVLPQERLKGKTMELEKALAELEGIILEHSCGYGGTKDFSSTCSACAQARLWYWLSKRYGFALMQYDSEALDKKLGKPAF